jgi:hypothetical protein
MSRRIEKDGKYFRMRRNKLVEIPWEWVGIFPAALGWKVRYKFWKRYERRKQRRQGKTSILNDY